MKNSLRWPALALMTVGACLPAVADEPAQAAPQSDHIAVVRDATTGKLRAPTAQEAQAMSTANAGTARTATLSAARSAAAPQLRFTRHPGGAANVRMTDELSTQLVVQRLGSGVVTMHMPAAAAKNAAAIRAEAGLDQAEK